MSKPAPQPDPQDAQTDLLATLAASRELGPEMDKALAESYMQKHQTPALVPQNQQADLPSRFNSSDLASAIVMVAGIAALVTLFLLKGPAALGFVWIFFIFGGWRWFGWSHRNAEYRARREEYRQARRRMRDERRARMLEYYYRRGDSEYYYRHGDSGRPAEAVPPAPTPPQVSAPQPPAQPTAAPLPPTAQAPVTPPAPPAPSGTGGTGGITPPINPAG